MACPLVADPRGDFPTWLATQGMKLKFAEAMERELGISDYEELLACAEDTQVMAELFGAAREKLPFAFYAVLRRILKAMSSGKRGKAKLAQSVMEVAVHPFMNSLLEAIVGTLNSLSHELLQSADRFSCLEPAMYTGEQAEADEALRSTNNSSCVVEEAPVEDSAFLAEEDPAETWEQGVEHAWVERHSPASAGPWSEPVESQLDVPPDFHEAEKEQRSHGSWGRLQVKTEIIPEDFVNATRGGAGEPPPAPPSPGARDAVDTDELDTVLGDVKNEMYRGLPKARVGSDHSAGLEAEVAAEEEEVVPVSRAWKAFAPPDTPSERYYAAVRLEECPRDPNTPHLRGPPCHPASAQLPTVSSAAPQQQRGTSWLRHRNVPHPHHSAVPFDGQLSCAQRSAYITATATTLSLDPTDRGGVAGSVGRRTRPDESPCACAVCGKVFTRARAYARHARTHTGEKPYRCEQCGKVFALSSYLKLHARTHTGEKPYRCRVCGRRFAATSNLAHHKKRHTGGGGGGGHHARAPHGTLPMTALGPSSHGSPGHGYEQ